MDAFDRAFMRCSKEEQEQILSMSAEDFARDLLRTFKHEDGDSDD